MSVDAVGYRRSPTALWRNVGADVLVTTPDADEIEAVSGSAVAIWDLLEESHTLPALLARLAGKYGIPESSIEPEVRGCVDGMLDRGVVVADA